MPQTPRAARDAASSKTPEDGSPAAAANAELERLREQIATLQADAEKRDEQDAGGLPAYENARAMTGHLEDRLARVTGHLSRIPKRGYNKEQKYNFVAHGDVLDAIRPALAVEGVQFRSKVTRTDSPAELLPSGDERRTAGGMVWRMWRVEVEFSFACWNDDKRCEQTTEGWPGYAQDYSDKGASKALTSAIKTFLIQQFLVSTGDDPDEPTTDNAGSAGGRSDARPAGGNGAPSVSGDVRQARNKALDYNTKLPSGVLSKIARKVAGNGVVMQIDSVPLLTKIATAAERYLANPEGGEAWLAGEAQKQSGEPEPDAAERQAAAEEPDVSVMQRDLSQPLQATPAPGTPEAGSDPADGSGRDSVPYEPVTLPPIDSYDPPLSDDERRQHALNLNPRPAREDDDDVPF